MSSKKIIQININKSYKIPLMLSSLIKDQSFDISNLSVKFILGKNVNVEIVDDIVCFEDLRALINANHDIEFVLHEDSDLYYSYSLKPKFASVSNQFIFPKSELDELNFNKKLKFNLVGANAYAKVRVRCFAYGLHKFKIETLQNHENENTFSCLCIKNVLCDGARIECDSKIKVTEEGFNVIANQVNRNLIIGSRAHVISTPQLEIENENVKCRHGAANKTIDDEQLFYLQSRGIDSVYAKRLLIQGFLG